MTCMLRRLWHVRACLWFLRKRRELWLRGETGIWHHVL